MSRINIFRSVFSSEAEELEFSEEKRIHELIDIDFDNSVIFVNGYKKDKEYILRNGDVCTIRVFPSGGGKPKEIWDTITETAGDIAHGIKSWVTNPKAQFWKFWNGTWENVGNLFRSWLEPDNKSTSNKSTDTSLKTIPTLQGANNQSGYGKVIPMSLGRHVLTPYYCGTPYHTISGDDGEKQTFHGLYMLGYNDIDVSEIKLGLTDLAHNTGNVRNGTINVDGKWNPSEYGISVELQQSAEVSLYPQKVVEEQLGVELIHTSDGQKILTVQRFSAKNPYKIEIEFTLQGLIGYDQNNGSELEKSVEVKCEISFNGGSTFSPFGMIVGANSYDPNTGISTIVRKKNKMMRFVAIRELTPGEGYYCTNRIAELRITRANPKDSQSNTADDVYLSAIRTWCFDYSKSNGSHLEPQIPVIESKRNMTARLGLQIDANELDFKNQLDSLNCIITARGRTWNGSAWSNETYPNNNPASMALRVLEHPSLGRYAYGAAKIDYDSFGELYEWANQNRSGTDSTHKFQCDGVITNKKKLRDIVSAILSTARARLVMNEHKYGVWIDKPRQNSVMILNNQNVLSASNSKSFADLPDGYKIKFVNKITWQTDEIKVMFDQSKAETPGMTFESMEMLFQTDAAQIFQNGKYSLACLKLRPETWIRKVSVDGNLIDFGSKVEVQDDTISVGIGDGAEIKHLVIEDGYITAVETDSEIYLSEIGGRYGIRVTCADGVHEPKVMAWEVTVSLAGKQSTFTLKEPILISETYKPNVGDILSFGVFERETIEALCFGKKDNGDGTFDLTLVPYDNGIYTADGGEIPEFDSKVTEIRQEYGGSIPTEVKQAFPTYEQVRTIARSEASEIRVLTSLLDAGSDGEVAIYNGAFFRFSSSQNAWIRLDDKSYLGAYPSGSVSYPDKAAIGSFFLAKNDMVIDNLLILHDDTALELSDGTYLELGEQAVRGFIYACSENGWTKITDRNDYRYIIAYNDLLAYGFELPTNFDTYVNSTAQSAVESGVVEYTPKYLGPLTAEPASFHEGDWFCWAGTTTETREQGRVYRYQKVGNQLAWVKLAEDDTENAKEMMTALQDILKLNNAGTSYFSTVFANALIANTAFINTLAVKVAKIDDLTSGAITVKKATDIADGSVSGMTTDHTKNEIAIHSDDWLNENSQTGFGIMKNGNAYFNNGKFRGEINATRGVLDKIKISDGETTNVFSIKRGLKRNVDRAQNTTFEALGNSFRVNESNFLLGEFYDCNGWINANGISLHVILESVTKITVDPAVWTEEKTYVGYNSRNGLIGLFQISQVHNALSPQSPTYLFGDAGTTYRPAGNETVDYYMISH